MTRFPSKIVHWTFWASVTACLVTYRPYIHLADRSLEMPWGWNVNSLMFVAIYHGARGIWNLIATSRSSLPSTVFSWTFSWTRMTIHVLHYLMGPFRSYHLGNSGNGFPYLRSGTDLLWSPQFSLHDTLFPPKEFVVKTLIKPQW